jgi:uncharacterized secreted repeat protein (TIGR03808 family)
MMRAMPVNRRDLLLGSLAAATLAVPARGAALSTFGLDATHHGVRPGAAGDQSRALQRAIEQAARARVPLLLPPGVYRAGGLTLPAGSQLVGVRGATRLTFTHGPSLLSAEHADAVTLNGLTFDGDGQSLPKDRGLLHLSDSKAVRIADCDIVSAGGNSVTLLACDGEVSRNTVTRAADTAIFCNDSRGLQIVANVIVKSGNGGIRVFQSAKRHDGSVIADNTIDDTDARAGGSGQNGNAVNVFRAADVIVRGNHIRNAAFSAIRGNAANNIQVIGNTCAGLQETAMYSEFDFEGAVFADNVIDTAQSGIAVTNFNNGGRLAIVHGNLLRNINTRRGDTPLQDINVGISAEAETAVTGNVIENALNAGIRAGWGPYLRNVTVSGNVVRDAGTGIQVSVVPGAGQAAITGNVIEHAKVAAILGMEWAKPVTGDLVKEGAARFPQLTVANNQAR